MNWLKRFWRSWFGETYSERYTRGWQYAQAAIEAGPAFVRMTEHNIDADCTFGHRDGFTDGARDALFHYREQGNESTDGNGSVGAGPVGFRAHEPDRARHE